VIRFRVGTALAILATLSCAGPPEHRGLLPPIDPDASGYLRVDPTHEIYWETFGDREGVPVIALQDAPGIGAAPETRRLFDPKRFFVLLYDQRGANRSRPRGEWRENTTNDLVEDINRLRKHVGIKRPALLFGGGWGSTLALAYAEQYPERVAGMVLRSIFLGTSDEIDYLYHGGAGAFYPENWERLRNVIPEPEVPDYHRQLFEMITGEDPKDRETAIEGWGYYRVRMSSMSMTEPLAEDGVLRLEDRLMPLSLLENYYMMNGCFLAQDQLMQHAAEIAHIPTFIVHGRFDAIFRPGSAWRLARRLDRAELVFTAAGDAETEPENVTALLDGLEWVARQIESDPSSGRDLEPLAWRR
jgi:proline iminopeptidase